MTMKFDAFSDCVYYSRGLTDRVVDAAYLVLVEGTSMTDAAEAAGVPRVALHYALKRLLKQYTSIESPDDFIVPGTRRKLRNRMSLAVPAGS